MRTVVFDCMTSTNLVVATNYGVTLSTSSAFSVELLDLPAPELDCFHVIVDDTNGGTEVSGGGGRDPQVTSVNGATTEVALVVDTAI